MVKLRQNRVFMVFITFLLVFVIAFSMVSKPFTARAVAGVDDALVLGMATMLIICGITVTDAVCTSDPDFARLMFDIYNSLETSLQDGLKSIFHSCGLGYSSFLDVPYDFVISVRTAILDYLNAHYFGHQVSGLITVTPNPNTGKVGFTSDTVFNFSTADGAKNSFDIVDFGQSFLYFGYVDKSIWGYYSESVANFYAGNDITKDGLVRLYRIVSDNVPLEAVTCTTYINADTTSNYNSYRFKAADYTSTPWTFTSRVFSKDSYGYLGFSNNLSGSFARLLEKVINRDTVFYDFDGYCYQLINSASGWVFARYDDPNITFNNLVFSDYYLGIEWFLSQCGLAADLNLLDTSAGSQGVTYVSHSTGNYIVFDQTIYDNTYILIQEMNDDGTLHLVLPGNQHDFEEVVEHPAIPLTPSVAPDYINVLPSEVPAVSTSPSLWNKFPFCIPYDIVNIFTVFSAEPQTPDFHLLIMPEDSFGLDNEPIYIDVNFSSYELLINILKFFIGASFCVWLIVFTKKIIK